MSKQILLFLLSCLLLPPGSAIAQGMTPNYRGDSSFTWVDNVPNCLGAAVCWHGLNGTGGLNAARVFSSFGQAVALDSSGNAFTYNDYPANTWTHQAAWGVVNAVNRGSDGTIFGLRSDPVNCASTPYQTYRASKWSGSAWVGLPACFSQMSTAVFGNLIGVNSTGDLWVSFDKGATWGPQTSGTVYTFVTNYLDTSGAFNYLALKADHTIWKFNGTSWTQLSGLALQVSADVSGNIYIIGTDNYGYHWSGSAWQKLAGGGKTFLSSGGTLQIFAIGTLAGGNSVYRLSDYTVRHTRTLSGSATCAIGCGTAMHTGHVQAGWGSSYGTQVNSGSVTPTTNINISSPADMLDPFTCFENPDLAGCLPSGGENVGCTQVGNIFSSNASGGPTAKHFEVAYGRALATSHVPQPHSWKYTVTNHCNSINPDLIPGVNIVNYLTYDPNMVAFDIEAGCYSFTGGRPWTCVAIPSYGITVQAGYPTDPGYKDNCTENP